MERPRPPAGFVPFKWTSKKFNVGTTSQYTANVCPVCGEFGFIYGPQGFTDKFFMSLRRLERKKHIKLLTREDWLHFSRYCLGECLNEECGCKFWHDFLCHPECSCGQWTYYYNPATSKINQKNSLTRWC